MIAGLDELSEDRVGDESGSDDIQGCNEQGGASAA